MRKPIVTPWTEEEIERLKLLQRQGMSPGRIAVALKRPVKSVMKKALAVGTPFPSRRQMRRTSERKEDEARVEAGLGKLVRRTPSGRLV
jgi:hypothetical protein